ncbi:steroid 17-alpha-hydroxylase/17,20 lyase-like isoform X1 [Montipora capricornis]|uniref:steroid 17-alpha-hydroxylase/17,20 lyase-like isoform X1 n=1 Tax=Montipora capricornis TaxID=246305 RepID=UPI0035F1A910
MALLLLNAICNLLSLGNIILVLLLFFLLHYVKVLYEFRDMPRGPRLTCLPIVGNILSLKTKVDKMAETFESLSKYYGGDFSLKLGSFKFLMVSTPEAVKEVLLVKSVAYAGRPRTRAYYDLFLGCKDLVFAEYGPAWKFYRKLFMTALRQYLSNIPLIESRVTCQAEKLIRFMEDQRGELFDPADHLMKAVANIICGITFKGGSDTQSPDLDRMLKLNAAFVANVDAFQKVLILDFFPWVRYLPTRIYERWMEPVREIHKIIRKRLKQTKENFDPTEPVEDFTSAMLCAQRDFEAECKSEEEKADLFSEDRFVTTIHDMFVAGYETTSTALRFVVAFMVTHPKYQEDIQRELDDVLGDRRPTLDDRPDLPLVQATILESLRVGNIVPLAVPHVTIENTTLRGYRVPKGTIVFPNTEAVHMDPKCWENPTIFNPYRHIDENGKLVANPDNFFPFGGGRRVCAGEALAKIELFLFISLLFQHFTFDAEEGYQLQMKGAIVQFPARYNIRAIKRKH